MPRVPKHKLDGIWRSGYCRATVEHARKTDAITGSAVRIAWLRTHIPQCQDCHFAAVLKAAEGQLAARIGPRAYVAFLAGTQDTTAALGYSDDLLREAITQLGRDGYLTDDFQAWMVGAAQRGPYQRKKR